MLYTPKNILVTGGCGFIASNVINHLMDNYSYKILNLDRLDDCSDVNNILEKHRLSERYKFVKGDISNYDFLIFLLEEFNIDTVLHFAAQTHVDNSFKSSLQHSKDNILGTHVLLEACRRNDRIKKIIHVSTDEVYGESEHEETEPKKPSTLLKPTNPYAASKAGAEMMVHSYIKSFKLPIIITRGNNVYGPRQYPEKLIPRFIQLLNENKKCTVHGDGSTVRAFLHVYDTAKAFDILIHKGAIHDIYNIESDEEFSVMEVLQMLAEHMKPDDDWREWVEYVEDRHWNDKRYFVDGAELKNLGWERKIDFKDGIKQTIEWYLEKWNK